MSDGKNLLGVIQEDDLDNMCQGQVLLYSSICVIISIPFLPCVLDIIIPLNDSRPLQQPFQVEYFIDHEKYFFPILAHLFVVIFVGLTIGLATDLLFITFLLHGCAMFAVLEYRLENMFNSSMEKFSNVNNMFYLRVASCVTHHKRVVKFVARINSYYTTSGAIQLILAVLILTILLLRLFERLTSIHNVDMADLAICIVHITGHLIVIFLNMFPTQKLLNCSETIFFKAYCSSWYWTPVRMQKLLLLIMQRSIKPCGITAAGRWKASLEMFSKIVETSMSYFMVLYTIRQ